MATPQMSRGGYLIGCVSSERCSLETAQCVSGLFAIVARPNVTGLRTVVVGEVEEAVDEASAAGEVLGHVVQPVGVDLGGKPRLLLHAERHPEGVEPGRVLQLPRVVVQRKELGP